MADDSNGKDSENSNFYRNTRSNNEDGNSDDENVQGASVGPDIGLGSNGHLKKSASTADAGLAGSSNFNNEPARREENPFSFKHFLNRDASSSGARPKVYPPKSPSTPRLISNPELTSGLPDFVQDHLVIEQCYLNQPSEPLSVDMDNLAEFGLEPSDESWNVREPSEGVCDLTSREDSQESAARRRARAGRHSQPPLDLPTGLPFDLPSQPPAAEGSSSATLPDFLSDGPIHSGRRPDIHQQTSDPNSPVVSPHSQLQSLQIENERLRRDQEMLRRQLSEQIRRNENLDSTLRVMRSRDTEDAASLESAVRQVEENLSRALKRAEVAESRVVKLKQEVKYLTLELSEVRGACGPSTSSGQGGRGERSSDQRLASELRAAVTSAEHSLRQMLSGVDTLRMIASALENRHRFDDQPEFSEPETRDDSGPAL